MRRLAAAGERGAATAAYRRLTDRLSRQLRIAPGAATRALADELLANNAGSAVEAHPAVLDTGFELAVSHYQRALERADDTNKGEARRGELLIGLGEAQTRAGRAGEARDAFEEAPHDRHASARSAAACPRDARVGVRILDLAETLAARFKEALEALPEADRELRAEEGVTLSV